MLPKLDFLVRYWELGARHAKMGQPLDEDERAELLGLMQLVGEAELPMPCSIERPNDAHPAHLIGEGAVRVVELRAVTANALFVAGVTTVSPNASVVLRAVDAIAGVEYAVPCRVAWVSQGSPATMALVVDGVPTRVLFDETPSLGPAIKNTSLGARAEALTG